MLVLLHLIDVMKRLWIPCPTNHELISGRGNKFIFCFVGRASSYNLENKAKLVHIFSLYVYFFSLHVSDNYVPIIRRNNYIYIYMRHLVFATLYG